MNQTITEEETTIKINKEELAEKAEELNELNKKKNNQKINLRDYTKEDLYEVWKAVMPSSALSSKRKVSDIVVSDESYTTYHLVVGKTLGRVSGKGEHRQAWYYEPNSTKFWKMLFTHGNKIVEKDLIPNYKDKPEYFKKIVEAGEETGLKEMFKKDDDEDNKLTQPIWVETDKNITILNNYTSDPSEYLETLDIKQVEYKPDSYKGFVLEYKENGVVEEKDFSSVLTSDRTLLIDQLYPELKEIYETMIKRQKRQSKEIENKVRAFKEKFSSELVANSL